MLKVSIIVPAYNVEEYICECLDSLVNQTLKEVEIIIVDDGSTDGTSVIIDEYAKRYENIRVLHKDNGGQSHARNIGLKMAEGEYILFVDSDDYIDILACETLYNYAKKNDVDIVHGDVLNSKDEVYSNPKFRWIPSEGQVISGFEYLKQAIETETYDIVPWLNLTRKSLLIENNLFFREGHFYEDQEYTLRLYTQFPSTVLKIRYPFYYYRIGRPGSTTSVCSLKKGTDFAVILKEMFSYIRNSDINDKQPMYQVLSLAFFHFTQVWLRLPSAKDRKKTLEAISNELKLSGLKDPYPNKQIQLRYLLFVCSPYFYYQRYGSNGLFAIFVKLVKAYSR
jgi:glycosyltransferase involved in cell wall biosynthesis